MNGVDRSQIWGDLWLLLAAQCLPVPVLLCYLLFCSQTPLTVFPQGWLLGLNLFLVLVRSAL
ncbi:MAG: hypothetical protein ACM65M_19645 [Microcoleus sp.]